MSSDGAVVRDESSRTLWCAALAYQANRMFLGSGRFVTPRGFRLLAVIGNREFPRLGFVIASRTTVAIVFRGTKDIVDLMKDLDRKQVPYPYAPNAGRTHQGYTSLYAKVVRGAVYSLLRKLPRRRTLIVAGHSLGGSLAALCAADLASNSGYRRPLVYTFGAPKLGDIRFAEFYKRMVRHSVRAANRFDLVPRYPFALVGDVYRHVGKLRRTDFQYWNIVGNHSIDHYYKRLAELSPDAARKLKASNPGLCPE